MARRFSALASTSSPDFLDSLADAVPALNESNAAAFYSRVLPHLAKTLHTRVRQAIFLAICRSLTIDQCLSVFVEQGYVSSLPFDNPNSYSDVLDILYFLASNRPDAITSDVASHFEAFATKEPSKVLTVLAICSQQSRHISIYNVLLDHPESFRDFHCSRSYISLLHSLAVNENLPRFRAQYGETVVAIFLELLQSARPQIASLLYQALSRLSDAGVPVVDIDAEQTAKDLNLPATESAVISLLLRVTPRHGNLNPLIESLIEKARGDDRCINVLLKMGHTEKKVVASLVNNPGWLKLDLPALKDTLRLLVMVITRQSESQKEDLATAENELVSFFMRYIKEPEEERLSITCTLMRRLPIAASFVEKLSANGFLDEYFRAVRKSALIPYGLILLKVFAGLTYTSEMVGLVNLCVEMAQNEDGRIAAAAIEAAAALARHPKCLAQLRRSPMADILGNQRRLSRSGRTLLNSLSRQ
jgi:hypothetical protein